MPNSENNKRIAKNTLLLYFRMMVTMGVSLYTSRIVLNTLGVEDFGIYNVVGGVIVMFTFLNNSMATATQRFLTFELGTGNKSQLKKIFSASITIHGAIAIIILILGETIGLWFLNNQMTIPAERMIAARWVYQFTVFSCMVIILNVPYNSAIIAHEKMNVFAYISILDVTFKLLIVFSLIYFNFDKLILYAAFLFIVSIITQLAYFVYCYINFEESKFKFLWDKVLYKEMMNFAGWTLFGNIAVIAYTQGLNLLLNVFFGPVVNAARGIAVQVQTAINGFSTNFQTALNPQITKAYSNNNISYMHSLIYSSSKYSYYLLFFLSLPVFIETNLILKWWLKIVPEHSDNFFRLIMFIALLDAIANPLVIAAAATGRIRKYQTIVGGLLLLILPISYLALKLGAIPEAVFIVQLIIAFSAFIARLWMLQPMINLSIGSYFKEVIFKVGLVSIISIISPMVLYLILPNTLLNFFLVCICSVLSVSTVVYYIGLNSQEKRFIKSKSVDIICRIKR